MKHTLLTTILALTGMVSMATAITLDDAVYSAKGSGIQDSTLVEDVAFNDATFTFTVDAAALTKAADKYDGQTILLTGMNSGYFSAGEHHDYYTLAWCVHYNNAADQLTFYSGYLNNGKFSQIGNYTLGTSTLDKIDVVCLTIRGLTKDGGGSVGIRYAFEGQIANSGFINYMNWRSNEAEDFEGIFFESLTVNPEFVSSYYLFDQVTTQSERKEIVTAATAAAPSIPEPATTSLSVLALAGLAWRRRRR